MSKPHLAGEIQPDPFRPLSLAYESERISLAVAAAVARRSSRPPAHSGMFVIRSIDASERSERGVTRASAPPPPILEDATLDAWFR